MQNVSEGPDALAWSAAAQSLFDDAKDENSTPEDSNRPVESSTCCMHKILSLQTDFQAEIPWLQTIIEAARHIGHFLPKFHCELNPIEVYWGWFKICGLHVLHLTQSSDLQA